MMLDGVNLYEIQVNEEKTLMEILDLLSRSFSYLKIWKDEETNSEVYHWLSQREFPLEEINGESYYWFPIQRDKNCDCKTN